MNIRGMGPQMADPEETARRRAISRVLETPEQAGIPAAGGEPTASRAMPGATVDYGGLAERGTRKPMPGGATLEEAPAPMAAAEPAPAPAAKPLYGLEGFEKDKLDSGHDSPKYMVGRTLQQFDPKHGLTPEAIAALNTLGIGTFSGQADKLSVQSDDPRWNGVFQFDVGRDFTKADGTTGSDAWSFQNDMPGQGGGAPAPAEVPFDNGGYSRSGVPAADGSSTYQKLLAQLQALTGMSPEQTALDRVLGGR